MSDETWHKGGVPWNRAKRPRPKHECSVQTEGYVGVLLIQRCACGALRANGRGGVWTEKNSRELATRSGR